MAERSIAPPKTLRLAVVNGVYEDLSAQKDTSGIEEG
jgi:hypothetical protein